MVSGGGGRYSGAGGGRCEAMGQVKGAEWKGRRTSQMLFHIGPPSLTWSCLTLCQLNIELPIVGPPLFPRRDPMVWATLHLIGDF